MCSTLRTCPYGVSHISGRIWRHSPIPSLLRILLIWLFPQLTAAAILRQDSPFSIRFNTSTRSSSVRILRLPAAAILIMVWISPRFHFSKDAHRQEASLFLGYAAAGVYIRLSDTMRINTKTFDNVCNPV